MVRVVGAASVLAAVVLTAGCGSDAGPASPPVPIVSVTEVSAFAEGWALSVQVDDYRGCPTAFAVQAEESAEEIRLTARAVKGENYKCGQIPTVALEGPVGSRRIVDASRDLGATSVTGKPLKDPCAGVDPCFVLEGEGQRRGRTFSLALAALAAR